MPWSTFVRHSSRLRTPCRDRTDRCDYRADNHRRSKSDPPDHPLENIGFCLSQPSGQIGLGDEVGQVEVLSAAQARQGFGPAHLKTRPPSAPSRLHVHRAQPSSRRHPSQSTAQLDARFAEDLNLSLLESLRIVASASHVSVRVLIDVLLEWTGRARRRLR